MRSAVTTTILDQQHANIIQLAFKLVLLFNIKLTIMLAVSDICTTPGFL